MYFGVLNESYLCNSCRPEAYRSTYSTAILQESISTGALMIKKWVFLKFFQKTSIYSLDPFFKKWLVKNFPQTTYVKQGIKCSLIKEKKRLIQILESG
jgi:hypothetical protein